MLNSSSWGTLQLAVVDWVIPDLVKELVHRLTEELDEVSNRIAPWSLAPSMSPY